MSYFKFVANFEDSFVKIIAVRLNNFSKCQQKAYLFDYWAIFHGFFLNLL